MKRFALSFFVTGSVPLTVLAALTANPARLYAESGLPGLACTAPEVEACAAKSSGETCAWDAGAGTCSPSGCTNADSGAYVAALQCFFVGNVRDAGSEAGLGVDDSASPGSEAGPDAIAEGAVDDV